MKIGNFLLSSNVFLAPMAGVTDRPFRQLCWQLGAGLVVSEMTSSNPDLRHSRKTQLRMNHQGEQTPVSVQIAGTEPQQMANAARFNVHHGAQIIDINMGCPARKVCRIQAGSALLKNEVLVAQILQAVVSAVDVPVTLKIRTGWDRQNRNALAIAHIAEDSGIAALTVHGRTREDGYKGEAEYETIAAVKSGVSIPVIANGDICSPRKALQVLEQTAADAVMIGRAAQGNPWIFREINYFLATGKMLVEPTSDEISQVLQQHLKNLYAFYGEVMGVRIARKHIGWYCRVHKSSEEFRQHINRIEDSSQQLQAVIHFFKNKNKTGLIAA